MPKAKPAECPPPPRFPYFCGGYRVYPDGRRVKAAPRNGRARLRHLKKVKGADYVHYI